MTGQTNARTDVRGRCAIAVMAKQSVPGRTKTRLIPHTGPEVAAALNTAFLKDVTTNLHVASELASIDAFMAYAPVGSEAFFRSILPRTVGYADVSLIETVKPTFGACLSHAVETLLGSGYASACVLNSDSPTLPPAYLVTAATALAAEGDRLVLGPSIDGGYYLLGVKSLHRRLFEDIDWSTERVLDQTVERAHELDLPVVELPTWYDVDELPMLQLLAGEVLAGRCFRSFGSRAVGGDHTRALLADLAQDQVWRDLLLDREPPHAEVA